MRQNVCSARKGGEPMRKIAVCDDEKAIRHEIVRLIEERRPEVEIAAFASGEELLGQEFAIYFLDIDLSGRSGLEIAGAIREKEQFHSIIIFITGYREYMEAAFDVQAYHYLVKPIRREKFFEVLDRAWKEVAALEERAAKKVLVKTAGTSKSVFLKDVYYVESNNKKVIFHTAHGSFEAYAKMESLEAEFGAVFYRCHRCYLVNMERIAAYSADTIELVGGEKLMLAQKKYPDFVKAFLRYVKAGRIVNV